MSIEFVTIESHFGVPENFIRAYTRNKCSENFVGIIKEAATILYPTEEFEIYLLPAEDGSYRDFIKIVKKKPLETATAVAAVGVLAVGFLTYLDSHAEYLHDEEMHVIDDVAKCLVLKQQIGELSKNYEMENIPEAKIDDICWNVRLKKLKNDRLKTLQGDDMIASDETILRDSESKVILDKKIERRDFESQIEALPEEEYVKENLEGVIELISLVVKQKKEGKGIPWKGVYYGDDIRDRGIDVLLNGEEINFFMQDVVFKRKIDEHEIVFSSGDNMKVVFDIKGNLNMDMSLSKSVYVKKVERFNEDVIEHIIRPLKNDEMSKNQLSLL